MPVAGNIRLLLSGPTVVRFATLVSCSPMLKILCRSIALSIAAALLNGCVTPRHPQPAAPVVPQVRYEPVRWNQIEGWQRDQPQEAWSAFLNSCRALGQRPEWTAVCIDAASAVSARTFFESRFN